MSSRVAARGQGTVTAGWWGERPREPFVNGLHTVRSGSFGHSPLRKVSIHDAHFPRVDADAHAGGGG